MHLHAVTDHLHALAPCEPALRPTHPHTARSTRTLSGPTGLAGRPGPRPVPAAGPDKVRDTRAVHATLTAIMEAYCGDRPLTQVRRLLTPQLYRKLTTGRRPPVYGRLRPVRVSRPAPDIVETTGLVETGSRVVAVAARLEYGGQHWQCTRFDVLEAGESPGRKAARAS